MTVMEGWGSGGRLMGWATFWLQGECTRAPRCGHK
eukprot:CAMPEP_0174322926 /NCGR_PEP_ID=MMETSP0810-20121108/11397_1 /TAXON_ID=73025 ORGANISM="Eutreptiella gymnastica-like, Strain CCMP1594" /NCGR_SAMPLE_ID=MMETSP0810 /ASSEMBLY_ACC=CAM_ASM_000659 /LENGTH=34 /DNA_ID= /DNA_START= /DNA_END= /DNA_ORIENTATION=